MAWEDTSRYSQGDKIRTSHEWTYKSGSFRMVIHQHRDEPGCWFVSVLPLDIRLRLTPASEVAMKSEAAALCERWFAKAVEVCAKARKDAGGGR